jgi:superfamily II DNA or RNA helicase
VISKQALEEFLTRERRSYNYLKRWTRADVLGELIERGIPRRFKTRPRLHQLVGYLVCMIERKWLLLYKPGLGKTKVVLDVLSATPVDERPQALVIVPKVVHMGTWEEQVQQHSDLSFASCEVTNTQRKWEALMASRADVTCIDYHGIALAVCRRALVKGKETLIRDDARIKQLQRKYGALVLDEIHRCKNHNTTRFGIFRQLTKHMQLIFGLTGTPHGRNAEDLWAEFFLVDRGETLGETLAVFREAMFEERKGYFGGTEYKFDAEKNGDTLNAMLRNRSLTYVEKECFDLPPLTHYVIHARLSPQQRAAYERIKAGERIGDVRVPIDGAFIRMREITSGYERKRVNGVQVTEHFAANPKLEAFEEYVLSIPSDCKFIVFYDYNPTGDLLAALLKRLKVRGLVLNGATKNTRNVERVFREDAGVRCLLCNSASGSEGINAQAANYELYYETPVSPIVREQSLKRAHRMGQTQHVTAVDFVVPGTVDERILEFLAEGRNLAQAIEGGDKRATRALFGPEK